MGTLAECYMLDVGQGSSNVLLLGEDLISIPICKECIGTVSKTRSDLRRALIFIETIRDDHQLLYGHRQYVNMAKTCNDFLKEIGTA